MTHFGLMTRDVRVASSRDILGSEARTTMLQSLVTSKVFTFAVLAWTMAVGTWLGLQSKRCFGTSRQRPWLHVPPYKRLKLTARVDYGMNLSAARRSLT